MDRAESEKIVPGPHGSCELPEAIEELRRILRHHIKTAGVKFRLSSNESIRASIMWFAILVT
jgi:hypothetical protein